MINNTKYYTILDVSPAASQTEIQKAYKKKSLKWHPDRHRQDQEKATQKFQEISEAYQILRDPEKRKLYDQFGEQVAQGCDSNDNNGRNTNPFSTMNGGSGSNVRFSFHSNMVDPNDLFNNMFAGEGIPEIFNSFGGLGGLGNLNNFRQQKPRFQRQGTPSYQRQGTPSYQRQNSKLNRDITVSLEELAEGGEKKIKLTDKRQDGSSFSRVFTIPLRPGWKAGTKITFPCPEYQQGGEIQFIIREKPHPYLIRDGDNLIWNWNITWAQSQKNLKVTLKVPGQQEDLVITTKDEILYDGNNIRYVGKGMPIKGNLLHRGDLIVKIAIKN